MPNRTVSLLRSIVSPLLIGSALLLAPAAAHAGDKALAEALFQEGRKLLDEGKYELACQKFEGSQRQDPSPGTLINLAKCNEGLGKTATAWANYKEAESLARNMSRSEQEQLARDRAGELEPVLSRLQIDPPPTAVDGLVVKRGGVAMSIDSLGVAAPVDPGQYDIEASAPGYETWKGKVTVGKEKDNAKIAIPDLVKSAEPATAPSAPPTTPEAAPPATGTSQGSVTADSAGGSTKTIGWVLTGAGAVALLAGGYFGYAASKQASDAENDSTLCPNKQCSPAGRDEIDRAKNKALVSTIGVGVGVAALGAGILLVVMSPSNKEQAVSSAKHRSKPSARFTPFTDGRNSGVMLSGAF
jgi:hypothetical protein